MFAKFDRFEDEVIARWVESQAPEMMESGAVGAELIIVPDCVFGAESTWKRIRRAVDRAIIGNFDAEWSAAQDSRMRCGIVIDGAGAIIVTRRIDGRKVCSVVGFTSHGICGSPSAPAELRELAQKSKAMIDVEWAKALIAEFKQNRSRFERSCRLTGCVNSCGRAINVRAWRVPGTPEHREWWTLTYNIANAERNLGYAIGILSNYDENCAGGVA